MKTMHFEQFGDASVLQFQSSEKPTLAANQVLIKVAAIGVNRADCLQRMGKYPPPKGESDILGLEVAGNIVAVGEDVDASVWMDKAVAALVAGGGYAEYAVCDIATCLVLPDSIDAIQGAATLETNITAYQTLFHIGKLQANDVVLIHAGASGVGTAAIQLAKAAGATVISTVGSAEKVTLCKQLGADHVINYREQNFSEIIKGELSLAVDIILDPVGGDYINKNIDIASQDARIISIAMMQHRFTQPLDLAKLLGKRIQLIGSTLRNQSNEYKAALIHAWHKQFGDAWQQGEINSVIDQVLDWSNASQAHQRLESNASKGKVILRVSS